MDEKPRVGFWKRQFTGDPTRRQTTYDVIFGIVMPLLCLVMDPVVFRGHFFPLLTYYSKLAYTFIGCEIFVLFLWLQLRDILGNGALFFSGLLLAGGVFALGIHAVMLPLTLRAMVVLIGFLGLTPFFTAFVYLRNACRAWTTQRNPMSTGRRISIVLAGMALMATPVLGVLHLHYGQSLPFFVDVVRGNVTVTERGAIIFDWGVR